MEETTRAVWNDVSGRDSASVDIQMSGSRMKYLNARFLSSLSFRGMDDRESRIAEAHENTLRWVFDPPTTERPNWQSLTGWLESDSQLYWITGKAGSGKSTLVKFLLQFKDDAASPDSGERQPRINRHLRKGSTAFVAASFYFWASGTVMQAAQAGLYQTLLTQLFSAETDLIRRVRPREWEAMWLFDKLPRPPSEDELRVLLRDLVAELAKTTRVCLFIDGLDEFRGEPQQLIDLVHELLKSPNVKMCVASRPWVVFQDAFLHLPSLRLDELTNCDIKDFVRNKLEDSPSFQRLQDREPGFSEGLVDSIVERANGVFLWVHLVVASLLAGMENDDRVSDILRRLARLPRELEQLYDAILRSIDPFYFEHAAQYFQLMAACGEPPEALLFAFADEEDDDFAIKLSGKPINTTAYERRIETVRRRINSRCMGFLELGTSSRAPYTIEYLHRTVKEYVEKPEIRTKFLQGMGRFDPNLRLCSASLAMIKVGFGVSKCELERDFLGEHLQLCLRAASRVSPGNIELMVKLLDDVRSSLKTQLPLETYQSWPFGGGIKVLVPRLEQKCGAGFLSLAVRAGVVEYVKARVSDDCVVRQDRPEARPKPEPTLQAPPPQSPSRRGIFGLGLSLRRKLNPKTSGLGPVAAPPPTQSASTFVDRTRGWPLLLDAVFQRGGEQMIASLLEHGADIGYPAPWGGTVWTEVLATFITRCRDLRHDMLEQKNEWNQWIPVLEVFFSHEAHVSVSVYERTLERLEGLGFEPSENLFSSLRKLEAGRTDSALNSFRTYSCYYT